MRPGIGARRWSSACPGRLPAAPGSAGSGRGNWRNSRTQPPVPPRNSVEPAEPEESRPGSRCRWPWSAERPRRATRSRCRRWRRRRRRAPMIQAQTPPIASSEAFASSGRSWRSSSALRRGTSASSSRLRIAFAISWRECRGCGWHASKLSSRVTSVHSFVRRNTGRDTGAASIAARTSAIVRTPSSVLQLVRGLVVGGLRRGRNVPALRHLHPPPWHARRRGCATPSRWWRSPAGERRPGPRRLAAAPAPWRQRHPGRPRLGERDRDRREDEHRACQADGVPVDRDGEAVEMGSEPVGAERVGDGLGSDRERDRDPGHWRDVPVCHLITIDCVLVDKCTPCPS